MNGYLLDTNIVSDWYDGNEVVQGYIDAFPRNSLIYISCITLGEIEFGHLVAALPDTEQQADFRRWIKKTFGDNMISVTKDTAHSYAFFRRLLCDKFVHRGKYIQNYEDASSDKIGIDENDLWLVSQAHEHGLKFATHDRMRKIKEVAEPHVDIETLLY